MCASLTTKRRSSGALKIPLAGLLCLMKKADWLASSEATKHCPLPLKTDRGHAKDGGPLRRRTCAHALETILGKRLPWLCINLITACLAGAVVGVFESTIETFAVLAIFLPIIAGQGGNAGMQTVTVIIRDMALENYPPETVAKHYSKRFPECPNWTNYRPDCGCCRLSAGGLFDGRLGWKLGLVVGLAMILTSEGCAIWSPDSVCLKILQVDPALASSILITTVTDVAGFFFLLALAKGS